MVRERNIPWPIYNYLEASSYIFHESLFLVRLWKSIFSVCLLSAMVFSGYWLKQHLNQSDLSLQGIFFHWLYLFLLSSPCVLKFLSELLTLLPLVLPFLRLFLAQNFFWTSPSWGGGGRYSRFLLTLSWAKFLGSSFLPSSCFSQTDFPAAAVLRTNYQVMQSILEPSRSWVFCMKTIQNG